ncbi:MAG: MerR family transcriptional regulator [Anaerovoracaceae bacterium]
MMKQYYKIGEISTLYGIGTDSLRYYEELGILAPQRDTNGYRMYSIKDIRTLNILRELRSIGFSMSDIKEHLNNFNLERTLELFQKEIEVVEQKKKELDSLEKQLQDRVQDIMENMNLDIEEGKTEIKLFPGRKVMKLNEDVYRDEDVDFLIKKLQKKSENKLQLIGNGYIGATAPLDYIMEGKYGHYNSVFYLLPPESKDYDYVLPEGEYICTTIKGSYSKAPTAATELITVAKEKGYTLGGDPLELYIIDNHDTNDETEYITELQILVK